MTEQEDRAKFETIKGDCRRQSINSIERALEALKQLLKDLANGSKLAQEIKAEIDELKLVLANRKLELDQAAKRIRKQQEERDIPPPAVSGLGI